MRTPRSVRGGWYTGGMPRIARDDPPGSTHHVSIRGVNGMTIFDGARDREHFLTHAEDVLPEAGITCLAWALLDNHAHLLLRLGATRLGTPMKRLLTSHAQFFNKRQERSGHLLQGRFHSTRVLDTGHLVEAVRYVFLNPVRAGLVRTLAELERYPWCGYAEVMGRCAPRLTDVGETLRSFGPTMESGRRALARWMAEGLSLSSDELDTRLHRFENPEDGEKKVLRPKLPGSRGGEGILAASGTRSSEEIIDGVCLALEVPVEALLNGSRRAAVCQARAVLAELLWRENGGSLSAVARALNLTPGGVYRIRRKGQAYLRHEAIRSTLGSAR
jgi:putative transposase